MLFRILPFLFILTFLCGCKTEDKKVLLLTTPETPKKEENIQEDKYYMIVFGAQSNLNLPRWTHTYAVFIKANQNKTIEQHCISWLPASLDVEPMRRTPEVGINIGWAETARLYSSDKMKANGVKIYMFGPYQISKNLYNMALVQIDKLESGSIKYICLDRFHRNKNICNCIHALSDLDSTQATLETGIAHGGGGSDMVVNHFSKHIIKSNENMSWIIDGLGIQTEVSNYSKPIINANAGIIRILRIVKR